MSPAEACAVCAGELDEDAHDDVCENCFRRTFDDRSAVAHIAQRHLSPDQAPRTPYRHEDTNERSDQ